MKTLSNIKNRLTEIYNLKYAISIIEWNNTVNDVPESGVEESIRVTSALKETVRSILLSDELISEIEEVASNIHQYEKTDQRLIQLVKKRQMRLLKIPKDEFSDYNSLCQKAANCWQKAKKEDDFDVFEPYLNKIVEYKRRFAGYINPSKKPYDVLLEEYEEGMTTQILDVFFNQLKQEIIPMRNKILDRDPLKNPFSKMSFSIENQKKISSVLLDIIGFDLNSGGLYESEHPFTMALSPLDVRLTTHYYENNLLSNLTSTAHEGGHGIYCQNMAFDFINTPLFNGASAAIHESQARLFENMFCLSKEFWYSFYPILTKNFPSQLKEIEMNDFYNYINQVTKSPIRIDSDELSYSLHIILRYEIEKALINDRITVKEAYTLWNNKSKEYLGFIPKTDSAGILQDMHWASGMFGYFPSYALGNAYAAQFYNYLNQEYNIKKSLLELDFGDINNWLSNNIHQHGSVYTADELLISIGNESLNPQYYIEYLKKKYKGIYGGL